MKKNTPVIYHMGYYRTANRLRGVRYITLFCFVLFTLLLFFLFRQDMTLNHFRYLLRNFDFSSNVTADTGDTMYYSGEAGSAFGFVDGGLACITDTRVFVTDRASGTTFSHYHGYTEPCAVFSEKYMAIYDRKGSSLSLYNAFAHLETLTFDGTVLAAALSDNGDLAVAVAEDGQYYSTVYVYNENLKEQNKLSKYKYVTALALSPNGKRLAVASLYPDDGGTMASELLLLTVGEKKAELTEVYQGEAISLLGYYDNDTLAAVSDGAYRVYDKRGQTVGEVLFDSTPDGAYLGKDSVMLLDQGADTRYATLAVYDSEGKPLLENVSISGRARSASADGENWYLLTENTLTVLNRKEKTAEAVDLSGEAYAFLRENGVFAYDGKTLYFATDSSAKALKNLLSEEKS